MEVSPGRRCQTRNRSSAAARRRRRRNEANETAKKVVESPANRVPAGLLLSWTYSPPPPLPPQMPRVGSSHSLSLFLFAPLKIFSNKEKSIKKKELTDTRSPFLVSSRRANQQKPYCIYTGANSTHALHIQLLPLGARLSSHVFFSSFLSQLFRKKRIAPFALFLNLVRARISFHFIQQYKMGFPDLSASGKVKKKRKILPVGNLLSIGNLKQNCCTSRLDICCLV